METEALRWFSQIADGATMTEVAEQVFMTQPGISRALDRLADDVGAPLLAKHGRTLQLTRAGAAFKRHVDAALHQLDDGVAAVEQVMDPENGTVTLAFHLSLGSWLVPDVVARFRSAHPGVGFELRAQRDETLPDEDRIDLEITTLRPTDRTRTWHFLFRQPLRLAVPGHHDLASRSEVSLREVSGESFVALRPAYQLRQQTEELCARAGFAPRVVYTGDDVPTVEGFVAAGLGVALVPATPARTRPSTGVRHLHVSDAGADREIALGRPATGRMLPAAELFRRHVVAAADRGLWSGIFSPRVTRARAPRRG